ncbi:hypothetical protein SAMN04487943_101316 [Gracilibacillus orientalis]|uniref:Uncharacterized protein n=1 Tax=Gracilibacillus orientalis TaxID=334253 RepID=A0A1I4HCN0_9BACI|nr:hypothetical protein [Gracilibacillus orientalis]SFL39181.1 hypothetical protein SAMN04487943_101316 [Gracilibacillus orientalis]
MCWHGTYKKVKVINPDQSENVVAVDACIADEIQLLNKNRIITLGCCCGHGKAGQIVEYKNAFGNWKTYHSPPITLIKEESVEKSKKAGYKPYPYHYVDGKQNGVWQMQLKTGCVTFQECEEWHRLNEIDN